MTQIEDKTIQINYFKKAILLFLMMYFVLYMLPFPLDGIPYIGNVFYLYTKLINICTILAGKHFFGFQHLIWIEYTGSSDSLLDYLRLLTILLLTIPVWIIALIFVRKYDCWDKIYDSFVVYARYYIGLYMIIYGFYKLDYEQFNSIDFFRLEQEYGNSSPMGLLWAFMGYSKAYTGFLSLIEIVTGLLLFFRRTTLLGSLFAFIVTMNVVIINFSYDVPVKIFASHLMLISAFLITPYLPHLCNFFIRGKHTQILPTKLILPEKWMRSCRLILKWIIIVCVPGYSLLGHFSSVNNNTTDKCLNGVYSTKLFVVNKDTLLPLTTDTIRWKKMIIERGFAKIISMTDSARYYYLSMDTLKKTIHIHSHDGKPDQYSFVYKYNAEGLFSIFGIHRKDSIHILFNKKSLNNYRLMSRGFHWVNEGPYNPY